MSLVGRNIRAILHRLGDALELFEEQKIYLVTQAANDLNLTFVVDEEQGDRLVERLHDLTVRHVPADRVLGPTWEQLHGRGRRDRAGSAPWWQTRRAELIEIAREHGSAYVYDRATLAEQRRRAASRSRASTSVFYAIKANPHPEILRAFAEQGLGFECVSRGEVERVLEAVPGIDPKRDSVHAEFRAARRSTSGRSSRRTWVTLDNLHPLRHWAELFNGRDAVRAHRHRLRPRPSRPRAHGRRALEVRRAAVRARRTRAPGRGTAGARIVGLHAHTGSGVFDVRNWQEVGQLLGGLAAALHRRAVVDLGGGLGVPEKPGQAPVDLAALQGVIDELRGRWPRLELWIEPGRFLVAQAGVLLAQVTQLKGKGDVHYVGVATGMNSLIRPALYGAHHDIVNLTRLGEPGTEVYNVVGPICESADSLRPRAAAAADRGRRRAADRERGRLRPRDEFVVQPARAGAWK